MDNRFFPTCQNCGSVQLKSVPYTKSLLDDGMGPEYVTEQETTKIRMACENGNAGVRQRNWCLCLWWHHLFIIFVFLLLHILQDNLWTRCKWKWISTRKQLWSGARSPRRMSQFNCKRPEVNKIILWCMIYAWIRTNIEYFLVFFFLFHFYTATTVVQTYRSMKILIWMWKISLACRIHRHLRPAEVWSAVRIVPAPFQRPQMHSQTLTTLIIWMEMVSFVWIWAKLLTQLVYQHMMPHWNWSLAAMFEFLFFFSHFNKIISSDLLKCSSIELGYVFFHCWSFVCITSSNKTQLNTINSID